MTLDSSDSLSTASKECTGVPHGIHIVGTDRASAPKVERMSRRERAAKPVPTAEKPTSWSYLFLHHLAAKKLRKWLEDYNARLADTAGAAGDEVVKVLRQPLEASSQVGEDSIGEEVVARPQPLGAGSQVGERCGDEEAVVRPQPFFVHQSYRYQYKDKERERGVRRTLEPSVSGLVFLQGSVRSLQTFLRQYFPQYHLVLDRSCGCPASIEDSVMQPFMRVAQSHPERVTILRDSFERFARDHVRLRILTGPFRGYEGYVVRIHRDRHLVFDFGGLAVAIKGIHQEVFEVV